MTSKEKGLLLKDLSARFLYGTIVSVTDGTIKYNAYIESISYKNIQVSPVSDSNFIAYTFYKISEVKPYLRPLSSMTKEEIDELKELCSIYIPTDSKNIGFEDYGILVFTHHLTDNSYSFKLNLNVIDWLNKNMFDYHGLIPMGLALEASEDMYKI